MSAPRTAAVQERSDVENQVMEILAHSAEEEAFTRRVVEDVARIRVAITNDLPLIAEQLSSRLLVVSQRRYRQVAGEDVELTRWGGAR